MKSKKNLLLCCLIGLSSTTAQTSEENFKNLKSKVDEYENSVIKDFSFAIPDNIHKDQKKQMKLGIQLEEEFYKQKKLFYTAEEGLFNIEDSLDEKVRTGELSQDESNRLVSSVEYARRIILYTRKSEIHSQYTSLRKKLTEAPALDELYKKISGITLPGNCKIKNAKLAQDTGLLSFEISGQNQEGKQLTNVYNISQQEIDRGLLTTRFERGEHMGNRDKMILRFNKTNPDASISSYSWLVNEFGKISPARVTGLRPKFQRMSTTAIKRGRCMGLISYMSSETAR